MRLSLPGQTPIRPGHGALSRDFRLSDQLPLTIDHVRSDIDPVVKHSPVLRLASSLLTNIDSNEDRIGPY